MASAGLTLGPGLTAGTTNRNSRTPEHLIMNSQLLTRGLAGQKWSVFSVLIKVIHKGEKHENTSRWLFFLIPCSLQGRWTAQRQLASCSICFCFVDGVLFCSALLISNSQQSFCLHQHLLGLQCVPPGPAHSFRPALTAIAIGGGYEMMTAVQYFQ